MRPQSNDYVERDKEIVRLRTEEAWSLKEIGNHFGITVERVRQICTGLGVDPRAAADQYMAKRIDSRHRRSVELTPSIMMRWMSGESVARIARDMKLPARLVGTTIAENATDEITALHDRNKTPDLEHGGGPEPLNPRYDRYWTEDRCWEALEGVARLHGGRLPGAHTYKRISAGKVMLPSFTLIRRRLGLWSTVRTEINRRLIET